MRRLPAVLVTVALAWPVLVPSPVQALPVFGEEDLFPYYGAYGVAGGCATSGGGDGFDLAVVENAPAVTQVSNRAHTSTNSGNAADNATASTSLVTTARLTSTGTNPKTVDFSSKGSVSSTAELGVRGCTAGYYSGSSLDADFVSTDAGFLTITWDVSANTSFETEVESNTTDEPFVSLESYLRPYSGTATVFLPAGSYEFAINATSTLVTDRTVAVTPTSAEVHAVFVKAAAQTAPLAGKAKKYLTAPASRSCATDSVDMAVTGKKSRAKTIKSVTYRVNGTKAGKVSGPKAGETVKVKVADGVPAEVLATVVLKPKAPGKPAKVLEATTSYAACS